MSAVRAHLSALNGLGSPALNHFSLDEDTVTFKVRTSSVRGTVSVSLFESSSYPRTGGLAYAEGCDELLQAIESIAEPLSDRASLDNCVRLLCRALGGPPELSELLASLPASGSSGGGASSSGAAGSSSLTMVQDDDDAAAMDVGDDEGGNDDDEDEERAERAREGEEAAAATAVTGSSASLFVTNMTTNEAECMLAPTELHRFIADKLRVTKLELTGRGEHARLSGIPIPTINRQLTEGARNVNVSYIHCMSTTDGRMPLKNFTVRGLDTYRCDEARFQEVCGACARCRDRTIPRQGAPIKERCKTPKRTTVAEWFARKFPSFPVTRPDWPCVLAGSQMDPGRFKVPLEFLRILPSQPVEETSPEMILPVLHELGAAATLSASTVSGFTPAHLAAQEGHGGCLRVLHELGAAATLSAVDAKGRTSAHYAACNGHDGCLRVLHELDTL